MTGLYQIGQKFLLEKPKFIAILVIKILTILFVIIPVERTQNERVV